MTHSEYVHCLARDLYRYGSGTDVGAFFRSLARYPGYRYTFWMRTTRFLRSRGAWWRPLCVVARLLLRHYEFRFGISIPYNADIGPGLYIGHFGGIVVHPDAKIGENCNINHDVTIGATYGGKRPGVPVIGDRVYLGPGSKILGGIRLGCDVAVGANCVVTETVPDRAVVIGVPGRVISEKGSTNYIRNLSV